MLQMKPPNGVSDSEFESILNAAVAAVQFHHRLPTVEEISKYSNVTSLKRIASILATKEFKAAIKLRGYDFDKKQYLKPEQIWAVSIITDPTNRKSLKEKLAQAGIQYWQYKAWLSQPVFANYVKEIGERLLNDHVHDVHTRVVERATNGDIQAMRLYYDLIGRTDSTTNKAVQDLSATVRLLLEVIMRNVTDTQVLNRITKEIEAVTSGQGVSGISEFQFGNIESSNVIKSEVVTKSPPDPEQVTTKPIGKDWLL